MGREFDQLFDQWAETYDDTVRGKDVEYKEVFLHYEEILDEVAKRAVGTVLEFGVGTGNLTKQLINQKLKVYGIEPSEEMRKIAIQKLPSIKIFDGDFLIFPAINEPIHSIVSSYAFHHLTDHEKANAISIYTNMLESGGKVVFADTMFKTKQAYLETVNQARSKGFYQLLNDLETEYYTTLPILTKIFNDHRFEVQFQQMNDFVWVLEAIKK